MRRNRDLFACEGWREFALRSIRTDDAARGAARVRLTETGETLHCVERLSLLSISLPHRAVEALAERRLSLCMRLSLLHVVGLRH